MCFSRAPHVYTTVFILFTWCVYCTTIVTQMRIGMCQLSRSMPGFFAASRGFFALLLGLLVLFCSVQRATSQTVDYCSDLPGNSELEGLMAETFMWSDAPSTPDVTILAPGRFFRGFSAVVCYECTDIRYPQSNVSQFEFGCTDGRWVAEVLGSAYGRRGRCLDFT